MEHRKEILEQSKTKTQQDKLDAAALSDVRVWVGPPALHPLSDCSSSWQASHLGHHQQFESPVQPRLHT